MDNNYWYARDKDGQLFAYREEPHKLSESWSNDDFDCECANQKLIFLKVFVAPAGSIS